MSKTTTKMNSDWETNMQAEEVQVILSHGLKIASKINESIQEWDSAPLAAAEKTNPSWSNLDAIFAF